MSLEEGSLHAGVNGKECVLKRYHIANLEAFSHEELVVMNQVLIAIPQARDFNDILNIIYTAVKGLSLVYACACYWMIDNGLGLHLVSSVGECKLFLPDVVPLGSDLFESIAARGHTEKSALRNIQLSLFDDDPKPIFCPIIHNDNLIGALALVHGSPKCRFLCALLNEAAFALELLSMAGYNSSIKSLLTTRQIYAGSGMIYKDEPVEKDKVEQDHDRLTAREKEVLQLLAEGMSTRDIAGRLFISISTCKHHIENILTKLHVHNRAAAVAIGFTRLGNDLSNS